VRVVASEKQGERKRARFFLSMSEILSRRREQTIFCVPKNKNDTSALILPYLSILIEDD